MRARISGILVFIVGILLLIGTLWPINSQSQSDRPNILLIVADDLGYSDITPFGGEINTPTLQKLADEGLMLTNFHVLPTCSPTRSVLMSGADNHLAGMGSMGEIVTSKQKGQPGYEGYLNDRVAHMPKIMKDAGYRTYMSGKWHLGSEKKHSPHARGFEETFTLLPGGGSHFADQRPLSPPQAMVYRRNGEVVETLPEDFYSTRNYTDYLLDWLERDKKTGKPFFAYLSYTAPHDPLHAPKEYIEKYKGKYDQGYNELRIQRHQNLKKLGIFGENTGMFPWSGLPTWDQLNDEEKAKSARDMEVYAAMVDYMDEQIARVFDLLEKNGEMENTLIVFFSDNGANGALPTAYPGYTEEFQNSFDNSLENRGLSNSFIEMGPAWATASMSPMRLFKSFTTEGGILSPSIIKLPAKTKNKGIILDAFTHVSDILPTFLEIVGIDHPSKSNPDIAGPMGKSLLPLLKGNIESLHPTDGIGYELHGLCAYFKGEWKILRLSKPFGTGEWELFNLRQDPAESKDLSEINTDKLQELVSEWEKYKDDVGIIYDPIDMRMIGDHE
jgi:arylsulfatase